MYCLIPFMCRVQNGQIHRHKAEDGCQWPGEGKLGTAANRNGILPGGDEGTLKPDTRGGCTRPASATCCWTVQFKMVDSCYVNFTSRRKKKKAREEKACVSSQARRRELCMVRLLWAAPSKESLATCPCVSSHKPLAIPSKRNVFNKDHQYNTGNYIQYLAITIMEKNRKKNIYMHN